MSDDTGATDNSIATDTTSTVTTSGRPSIAWRIGVFALGGAILAILIAMLSLTLARYGVIDKLDGFRWYVKSNYIGGASGLIGLLALVVAAMRKTSGKLSGIIAIVIGLAMVGIFYFAVISPARSNPNLHDATTDLDDPPQFRELTLREDNLAMFDGDEAAWKSLHREGYPNLQPIIVNKAPADVIADARALAEDRGWDIAAYDPAAGRMEATAEAGYIRFYDDVVVEVTPIADGSSRVDMRSVSRVGGSDLGYNAARIREFLIDLGNS